MVWVPRNHGEDCVGIQISPFGTTNTIMKQRLCQWAWTKRANWILAQGAPAGFPVGANLGISIRMGHSSIVRLICFPDSTSPRRDVGICRAWTAHSVAVDGICLHVEPQAHPMCTYWKGDLCLPLRHNHSSLTLRWSEPVNNGSQAAAPLQLTLPSEEDGCADLAVFRQTGADSKCIRELQAAASSSPGCLQGCPSA